MTAIVTAKQHVQRVTDDELKSAVSSCNTVLSVLKHLNIHVSGSTHALISIRIRNLRDQGLDTSHFPGNFGRVKSTELLREDLLLRLINDTSVVKFALDRLVKAGFKERKCESCGITEWQGQPAPLQVDHVDGDSRNNTLENLRVLCANCHVLTETWGFKNARKSTRRKNKLSSSNG